MAALQKALRLLPENVFGGGLGHVYAAAGREAEADECLRRLEALPPDQYLEPYNMAAIFAGIGNVERAFEWLQRAYDDRSIWLASFVIGDPSFDSLRTDSRFDRIVRPFKASR